MEADGMATYAKIYAVIWHNKNFKKLTSEEKVIAFYCLTGPQKTACGLFSFSIGAGSEHCSIKLETFRKGFGAVCRGMKWRYDPEAMVLYIPDWWQWNIPSNPNMLKSYLGFLDDLPKTSLLNDFRKNVTHLSETFRVTFQERLALCSTPEPEPEPKLEPEPELELESAAKTPPGLLALIEGWSNLDSSIVAPGNGVKIGKPSNVLQKAWKRTTRDNNLREAVSDVPALMAAIRKATFCHKQGWFSVVWLLSKNKNSELNSERILAGAYDEAGNQISQLRTIGYDPQRPVTPL